VPIMPKAAWSWMLHQYEYVPAARPSTVKGVGLLPVGTDGPAAVTGPKVQEVAVHVGASGPMIMLCDAAVVLLSTKVTSPAATVIAAGLKKSCTPVPVAVPPMNTSMPAAVGVGVGAASVGCELGEGVGAAVAVGVGATVAVGVGD
jgi:hypothetical protein